MTKNKSLFELKPGDLIYIDFGYKRTKAKIINNHPHHNKISFKAYHIRIFNLCLMGTIEATSYKDYYFNNYELYNVFKKK